MLHLFILTFVIFLSIHIAGDKSKLSLTTNCVITESIYFYYTLQSHSFDFLYLLPFFFLGEWGLHSQMKWPDARYPNEVLRFMSPS